MRLAGTMAEITERYFPPDPFAHLGCQEPEFSTESSTLGLDKMGSPFFIAFFGVLVASAIHLSKPLSRKAQNVIPVAKPQTSTALDSAGTSEEDAPQRTAPEAASDSARGSHRIGSWKGSRRNVLQPRSNTPQPEDATQTSLRSSAWPVSARSDEPERGAERGLSAIEAELLVHLDWMREQRAAAEVLREAGAPRPGVLRVEATVIKEGDLQI